MTPVGFSEWLAVGRAIAHKSLSRYEGQGQFVARFEHRLTQMLGVRHALTVTSGTGALVAALTATGIGPGDEVLVPAYTWMATAAAPLMVGAVPVLVEIDESLTMDVADMIAKITPFTRAIIPVHMGNAPADMDEIMRIARERRLIVIEDACQAVGVRYRDRFCGAIGDAGVFSFNSHKNINIGEGGAVLTNSDKIFARARNYHDLGASWRGHDDTFNEGSFIGTNMRANEIQGAMLGVQLSKLGPRMDRLQSWRRTISEDLGTSAAFRLSPHHSPENAVAVTVLFEHARDARAFATRRGVTSLMDNSKHIYTNWGPVLSKQLCHPKMDPWAWAHRPIEYAPDSCPKTLDILARTCRIGLARRYPPPVARFLARRLLLS